MRLLVGLLLLSACENGPAAVEVTPTQYNATRQQQIALLPGGDVDLVRPPQGGFVLFIGVRARGLDEATVELESRLFDGDSLASADRRTVVLHPMPDDAKVFTPDLTDFTSVNHLAMCPLPPEATADRFDRPLLLRQSVREPGSGRLGSTEIEVVPRCRQTDPVELARCRCECETGYVLGKC